MALQSSPPVPSEGKAPLMMISRRSTFLELVSRVAAMPADQLPPGPGGAVRPAKRHREWFSPEALEVDRAILATEEVDAEPVYWKRAVRVISDAELDAARPSWHSLVYGKSESRFSPARWEGFPVAPVPTAVELDRHEERLVPRSTEPHRKEHRETMRWAREVFLGEVKNAPPKPVKRRRATPRRGTL